VALMVVWPWLDTSGPDAAGVWFAAARRRQNVVFLVILLAILVLMFVGTFMRGPYWNFYWPWQAWPEIPGRI
jgi:cytochrome b-561